MVELNSIRPGGGPVASSLAHAQPTVRVARSSAALYQLAGVRQLHHFMVFCCYLVWFVTTVRRPFVCLSLWVQYFFFFLCRLKVRTNPPLLSNNNG